MVSHSCHCGHSLERTKNRSAYLGVLLLTVVAIGKPVIADEDPRTALTKAMHDLEAPLVAGFSDPNRISYGPARDAALEAFRRLKQRNDPTNEYWFWGRYARLEI